MRANTLEDVLQRLVICEPTVLPTGCWEWPGYRCTGGYGAISMSGQPRMIHVLIYEHFRGKVAAGMELDHLCRNRICANPDHLEEVTHAENCRRATVHRPLKTHCIWGHPFSGDNLIVDSKGRRSCRECRSRITHAYQERQRGNRPHRGRPQERTCCPKGHPYSGEHLGVNAKGERFCLTCRRENSRLSQARRRRKLGKPEGPLKGEQHGQAKLTAAIVIEMRRLHVAGVLQKQIAHQFGLSPAQTSAILNHKAWTHV